MLDVESFVKALATNKKNPTPEEYLEYLTKVIAHFDIKDPVARAQAGIILTKLLYKCTTLDITIHCRYDAWVQAIGGRRVSEPVESVPHEEATSKRPKVSKKKPAKQNVKDLFF